MFFHSKKKVEKSFFLDVVLVVFSDVFPRFLLVLSVFNSCFLVSLSTNFPVVLNRIGSFAVGTLDKNLARAIFYSVGLGGWKRVLIALRVQTNIETGLNP